MKDLYKPGNILKSTIRDSRDQIFIMVCKELDYRTNQFRAIVIYSGNQPDTFEESGTIHNDYDKGSWELSSLSEAIEQEKHNNIVRNYYLPIIK